MAGRAATVGDTLQDTIAAAGHTMSLAAALWPAVDAVGQHSGYGIAGPARLVRAGS